MPGTSLRKTISAAPTVCHEEPQQVLLRRVLSTRPIHCNLTSADGSSMSLMTFDSPAVSKVEDDAKIRPSSVKMRRTKGKPPAPRPASLDLSSINQVFQPAPSRSFSQERISGVSCMKRNNLSLFVPDAAPRRGSLKSRKSKKAKALRQSLVRSATVMGESIKLPIGDYLKDSWEAFIIKITEKQSQLSKLLRWVFYILLFTTKTAFIRQSWIWWSCSAWVFNIFTFLCVGGV